MLRKLRGYSLIVEISLFPWINASDSLRNIFYAFFLLNLLFDFINLNFEKFRFTKIDSLIVASCLLFFFHPSSYISDMSFDVYIFKLGLFVIRYILVDVKLISENPFFFTLMVIISSIASLYGWQLGLGDPVRLNYPYGDSNYQSFIFGTYFFILLIFLSIIKSKKIKFFIIIAMILSFIILLFGASRGSFIAFAITFIFYLYKKLNFKKLVVLLSVTTLISIFSFIPNFLSESPILVIDRFINPIESDIGASDSRISEIKVAFKNMYAEPFIFLFGSGFSSTNEQNYILKNKDLTISRIHNTPIAILYDSGILGLILFILLVTSMYLDNINRDTMFLFIFIIINSLTFFIYFYHLFICVRIISWRRNFIL